MKKLVSYNLVEFITFIRRRFSNPSKLLMISELSPQHNHHNAQSKHPPMFAKKFHLAGSSDDCNFPLFIIEPKSHDLETFIIIGLNFKKRQRKRFLLTTAPLDRFCDLFNSADTSSESERKGLMRHLSHFVLLSLQKPFSSCNYVAAAAVWRLFGTKLRVLVSSSHDLAKKKTN